MSIMPQDPEGKTDPHPSEACACGHDETDHGDVTGCIHCGRCWEYVPRSSYVSVEQDADEPDCGHHSWAGLMSLLDEHWPVDIFPTRYEDDLARDAGARIVSLVRWLDQQRAVVVRVRELAETWERRSRTYSAADERDKAIEARQRAAALRLAINGDA